MKLTTLYPVRRAPRYAMHLEKFAAKGKPEFSPEMYVLVGKFLERINRVVGPDSRNPVKDIQDELAIARIDYLSDVNLLMTLFAKNSIIGRTPLSSILPNPLPDHISLLNIIGAAVDRLLLRAATTWYSKNYGKAQTKSGSAEDFYVYYGDIPCYIFGLRTAKGTNVDEPYQSMPLMVFTTNYLDQLFRLHQQNPKLSEEELLKKFPPNHKDVSAGALSEAVGAEPDLAFVNIAPILKEYQHGDVYSAVKAALDAAVAANAKVLIKAGVWGPRSEKERAWREQEQSQHEMADEQGTVPGVPSKMKAPPAATTPEHQMPTDVDTNTRPVV